MPLEIKQAVDLPLDVVIVKDRFRQTIGNIEELADSIRQRGQIIPIMVDTNMRLLHGERRILAHKLLGRSTIRAEIVEAGSEFDRLSIELDENVQRLPFTWTDQAKLEKAIWDRKRAKDPHWTQRDHETYRDMPRTTLRRRIELAEAIELLPELAECETQDDAWKKFKKLEEIVAVGQLRSQVPDHVRNAPLWAHEHYIIGNALEQLPLITSESADFAEVDPPYGIDLVRRKSRNQDEGHTDDYSEIDADEFPGFIKLVIAETYRILKPHTLAVFWFGMQWYTDVHAWLTQAGFAVNPMCAIWYKGESGQTAQPDVALASCYEPFFLARKGQPKMDRQGRGNVFHHSSVPPARKIHSTEKPIELLMDIIHTILPDSTGGNILVPFLGSGVTLRAAYRLGHTGFGFDLSEANKERFLAALGKESTDPDMASAIT